MLNDDGDTQIVSCRDGYLVRQEKMCAVARQDVCCDKTRPLLWQDTREPQRAAAAEGGRPPLWRRPKAASLVPCHHRGLVLPQPDILRCRSAHLVSPHERPVSSHVRPPPPRPKCAVRDPVSSHVRPPRPRPKCAIRDFSRRQSVSQSDGGDGSKPGFAGNQTRMLSF